MKKILLFAVIMIAAFSINNLNAQVKGGFKIGVDFSKLKMDFDDGSSSDDADTKRLISPRLGFIIEVPVNDFLFVHAGLFGAAKGWRLSSEEMGEKTKFIEVIGTLDIPVHFGYKYDLGNVKLFGMVGPMISYNVYTTLLFKNGDEGWDNNNDIKIGTSEADTFKPLNLGMNIEAGIELSAFQFSAFFTQGLSNFSNIDSDIYTTNVFGIAAAVKFGKVDGKRGGFRR